MELTVTVTWMDGKQETYRCYDARARAIPLHLTQRLNSGQPARAIPLASVRIWTTEGG